MWILAFQKTINSSEKLHWTKKVKEKRTQRQSGTPALSYNAVHHLHCYCTKGFHWLCKTSTYQIINSYEDCLWTLVCQSGPISNSSKAVFLFLQVSTHIKLMLEQDYLLISVIHTYSLLYERLDWWFPPNLGAQCVDTCHSLFEAVQEVFRQAVPVTRQTLPVLQNCLHTEPGVWG